MLMHQQQQQEQQQQPSQLLEQTPSSEELCNLLVQGLIAKDEKLLNKVLEQSDEVVIKDILNRVPVNHVRKLIIELTNILATQLSTNHLIWLQHLLALKYSVVSSMADGRSILLPLISLLDDKSSPLYYNKMLSLKGKLTLLRQLREARKYDTKAETVVRVQVESDQPAQMEIESDTDTESEDDFDDEDDLGDESNPKARNHDEADDVMEEDEDEADDDEQEDDDNDDDDDDDEIVAEEDES